MTIEFKLSKSSKKKLLKLGFAAVPDHFTLDDLNYWLRNNGSDLGKKQKFILESLKSLLSYDLKAHLKGKNPDLKKKKKTSWLNYAKFGGLFVAGTLMEGIEGFNGIAAVIGLISKTLFAIPGFVSVIVGSFFSIVSISVFYAFELTQIANYFGISFSKARGLVDVYIDQLALIRDIQREIGKKIIKVEDLNELNNYQITLDILSKQYDSVALATETLNKQLNQPLMKVAKVVTAVIAGILYAAGGFFSGQALGALVAVAAAGTLTAAVCPPLIILACVIATICLYWFVERPALQKLIGRAIGLDNEKIDQLSDKKTAKVDRENVSILRDYIHTRKSAIEANQILVSGQEKDTLETLQEVPSVQSSNPTVPVVEFSESPERDTVTQLPSVAQFSFLTNPTVRQDDSSELIASPEGDTVPIHSTPAQ